MVSLSYVSSKGQKGAHHAGFGGGDCKNRKDGFVGFRDERSSDVWDRDGRHIEGYLNGCMYKFVYMVYVH